MSYHAAAQNAVMNSSLGMLGSAVQGVTGISSGTISTNAYQNSFTPSKDNHVFSCDKVENGWTFVYRNKTHIARTVDEMMEMMKAAMVVERIEK